MHKTFIYVLTDGSKFQEERKEERDDVASQRRIRTSSHCETSPLYNHWMRVNEKRLTFVNTRQLKLCPVWNSSSPDCITALKGPIDLTRANTEDHVKITRPVLGLGREASLREDVDGSGDQPTLQGKETSLKMWKWSKGKENKKRCQ